MKRRDLLAATLVMPLSGALPGGAKAVNAARLGAKALPRARVRPADPMWPSPASWAQLKDQVGGNLIEVQPLFGSCATEAKGATCLEALKNLTNPYWIGDQPAGTEVSGWLDAWTPAPSVYAIKARNAADIAAGVTFAREKNLRLVIKGGSHSYLGTSNAPDSLLIWTRAMNEVVLHDAFVPKGCEGSVQPVPAVSAQAGAVWMDLYKAVTTEAGRYVQGGGCTTVGVAGLVQSGGFGSFSKRFGTAAAGLLEAEVVTADGRVLIANARGNSDLFWALKGGGGSTFGVVTRLTLRTHELPKFLGSVSGRIEAHSDDAFRKLIARFVRFFQQSLFNSSWGEQVALGPDNTLKISMVSQGLDKAQLERVWQPFSGWVQASPADFSFVDPLSFGVIGQSRSWWDLGVNPAIVRDTREGAPQDRGWWRGDRDQVGAFLHGFESLWLPASLLQDAQQSRLADALFAASRHKLVQLHINKGLAGAPPAALAAVRDTATNPAVLDAFALVIIAGGERPTYPGLARPPMDLVAARKDARAIDAATAELLKIVPNAGSYVSESNYFNPAWQSAYWGSHYSRLRAIKAKYDPEGLFFIHHGVGSEDWSADGFTRV
jgi:FAD/FMN-containing dehydrogenase